MTHLPIIFSAPMVRAILEGRKTQTRRIVAPSMPYHPDRAKAAIHSNGKVTIVPAELDMLTVYSPYGMRGTRLWVRENFRFGRGYDGVRPSEVPEPSDVRVRIHYDADGAAPEWAGKARPSIFMPRWASRLTLEITDVRIERLHEIDAADCAAEGFGAPGFDAEHPDRWPATANLMIEAFASAWRRMHDKRPSCGWDDNPYVWAVTFKRVEAANG